MQIEMPRKGDGWESYQSIIDGLDFDSPEDYGFEDADEMGEFLEGSGRYSHKRDFIPGEEDVADQRREASNTYPTCHRCQEELDLAMANGAMRGEVDINPRATEDYGAIEQDTHRHDQDSKLEHQLVAYCPDHTDVWYLYLEAEYDG